jgi:hypothetical protein
MTSKKTFLTMLGLTALSAALTPYLMGTGFWLFMNDFAVSNFMAAQANAYGIVILMMSFLMFPVTVGIGIVTLEAYEDWVGIQNGEEDNEVCEV